MKKALFTVVALGVIALNANIFLNLNNYERTAKVENVNHDVVSFLDEQGHVWNWELGKGESFRKGETVTLKMNDCGTASILDDVILKVIK